MRTDTLFQLCFYFCVCMLIFNLSVSFVSAANFYETSVNPGKELGDNADSISKKASEGGQDLDPEEDELPTDGFNFEDIWTIVVAGSLAAIGAVLTAIFTRDIRVLGVYAFGVFFWASYLNMLVITELTQWFPELGFQAIFHGAVTFVFIGAVVGMASGSG